MNSAHLSYPITEGSCTQPRCCPVLTPISLEVTDHLNQFRFYQLVEQQRMSTSPFLTKHYFFYLKDISFASFRGKKWIFWKKIIYVLLVKQLDTQNPHLGARYHSSWFSCVRVDQMFCFDKRAQIICLKMKKKRKEKCWKMLNKRSLFQRKIAHHKWWKWTALDGNMQSYLNSLIMLEKWLAREFEKSASCYLTFQACI